jgi:hypothetical protein
LAEQVQCCVLVAIDPQAEAATPAS